MSVNYCRLKITSFVGVNESYIVFINHEEILTPTEKLILTSMRVNYQVNKAKTSQSTHTHAFSSIVNDIFYNRHMKKTTILLISNTFSPKRMNCCMYRVKACKVNNILTVIINIIINNNYTCILLSLSFAVG